MAIRKPVLSVGYNNYKCTGDFVSDCNDIRILQTVMHNYISSGPKRQWSFGWETGINCLLGYRHQWSTQTPGINQASNGTLRNWSELDSEHWETSVNGLITNMIGLFQRSYKLCATCKLSSGPQLSQFPFLSADPNVKRRRRYSVQALVRQPSISVRSVGIWVCFPSFSQRRCSYRWKSVAN